MSRGIRVGISERLLGECIQKNNELQQEVERLTKDMRTLESLNTELRKEYVEVVERLKQEYEKLKSTLKDAYIYKKKYYEIKSCRKLYEDAKRENEKLKQKIYKLEFEKCEED